MAYSNFGAQFQAFVIRVAEVCKTFVTTDALTSALSNKLDKTGTAASATKATKDASGNTITTSYGASLTGNGTNTITLKSKSGAELSKITINNVAKATTADSATTATTASTCTGNSATATKATQDSSGNTITSTYLTKTAASNTYLGKSANAVSATKATQDSDGKQINSTYAKLTGAHFTGAVKAPSFQATSDRNLKSDLIPITEAYDKLDKLYGYTYNLKNVDGRLAGLIAQDVKKVLPEAVKEIDGHLTLDYNAVIALLVEAVKELKIEVKGLKYGK